MRIGVDPGTELREEQCERQHTPHKPVSNSGHGLIYLGLTRLDFKPQYTPALAL